MTDTENKLQNKISITLKNYILMAIGCLLYAAGVALFLSPNDLASGGVSGISIIVSDFVDQIPVGTWVIIFNIPLLVAGVWKLGMKILLPTFFSIGISSVMMNLLEGNIPAVTSNPLLACVAGSSLVATGIGLVFRGGGTTGGTDIVVKLLRLKYKHISTGVIFFVADGLVCLTSGIVFEDFDKALYAGIGVFVQMFVLNTVLYGSDEARIVYIISERDSVIACRLLAEIDTGVTFLRGHGGYTGKERKVLMCAVKMRMLPQARQIVSEEDSDAFMIVTKATSVFGEGYKSYTEEDL